MKQLTIAGEQFEVPGPEETGLVEGHVLTAAEARHLFQVRCENIRNNMAKYVKTEMEKGTDRATIAGDVAKYAKEYFFSMPGAGGGARRLDPVEREAQTLAKAAIKAKLNGEGRKLTDVPSGLTKEEWDEKLQAAIEQVAAREDILKMAKKRVADRQKVTEGATSELVL